MSTAQVREASADTSRLVAKRLRTGEIAIWDGARQAVVLVAVDSGDLATARVIRGAGLKSLDKALDSVVVLI